MRVLIVSWEYPPIVEGGLAPPCPQARRGPRARGRRGPRADARRRASTRRWRTATASIVHRVREPEFPKDDLDAFVAWVDAMNDDMRAAGAALGDAIAFDLVHRHDWLVARRCAELARRLKCPWLVTVHATEHGRHQGWVEKHPQRYIHGVERRMVRARRPRDHVLALHARARRRRVRIDEARDHRDPERDRPRGPAAVDDLAALRARFAAPDERLVLLVGRLVYEKGFQLALDALPGVIERVGGRALPGRRLGDAERSCARRRRGSA